MILSYSKENIEKRGFIKKILNGTKKHTIRLDKHNRWKPGMSIQHYAMNPRNGGYKFAEGKVKAVASITINPDNNTIDIVGELFAAYYGLGNLDQFAINDGFESWEEMKTFFPEYFEGKIIYFKDTKEAK